MPKTAITGSLIAVDFDKDGDQPIYRQLTDWLKRAIETGRLAGGTKLPSTRIFAKELGVSRNTVLQAFESLTEEGYLSSRVGAGTFVLDPGVILAAAEEATAAPVARNPRGGRRDGDARSGYPFRSLSLRGKRLIGSSTGEFSVRPTPFMPDLPDIREFPIRTWMRLLNETSGRLTGQILSESSSAGYEPLRHAIAQYLRAGRGLLCEDEQVIVTTGTQQGLDLICRMVIDPGDPVWLEEPTYIGTRTIVRANGGALFPVPVDGDGLDIERAMDRCPNPKLVLVSPSRQYPLGSMMSQARRECLVGLAKRSGTWIVEDDYDNEFIYGGNAVPPLFSLDKEARTFYVGTFSKTLLPSFRLGYIVVPADLVGAFSVARAVVDRHASLIEQMVLSEFMNRGLFVSHIRRMRSLYSSRRKLLSDGLQEMFGADALETSAESGTHLIMALAPGAGDRRLARQFAQRGIVMRPLSPYYLTNTPREGLLFGFSAFNEAELVRAFESLAPHRREILALRP